MSSCRNVASHSGSLDYQENCCNKHTMVNALFELMGCSQQCLTRASDLTVRDTPFMSTQYKARFCTAHYIHGKIEQADEYVLHQPGCPTQIQTQTQTDRGERGYLPMFSRPMRCCTASRLGCCWALDSFCPGWLPAASNSRMRQAKAAPVM